VGKRPVLGVRSGVATGFAYLAFGQANKYIVMFALPWGAAALQTPCLLMEGASATAADLFFF
jgi:hypothetical protein